jgi:hypothetical protein
LLATSRGSVGDFIDIRSALTKLSGSRRLRLASSIRRAKIFRNLLDVRLVEIRPMHSDTIGRFHFENRSGLMMKKERAGCDD